MNKAEEEYLSKVQAIGCLVCINLGYGNTPAQIHHVRAGQGKSQRAKHIGGVLPLCPGHHLIGGYGVAFHAGKQIWQEKYGTEQELLEQVARILEQQEESYV